jgi:hypothetical protein
MVNTVRETRKQVRKAERCATLHLPFRHFEAASHGGAVRVKCVTNFENSKSFLEIFGDTTKNLRNQSTRPCASATSLVGSKVDKGVALEFRTTTCPLRFQYLAMRHNKLAETQWSVANNGRSSFFVVPFRLNSSLAQRSQSPMTICRMSPASPRSLLFALACVLEDPTHEERAEERSKPKSVRAVCCFPSLWIVFFLLGWTRMITNKIKT